MNDHDIMGSEPEEFGGFESDDLEMHETMRGGESQPLTLEGFTVGDFPGVFSSELEQVEGFNEARAVSMGEAGEFSPVTEDMLKANIAGLEDFATPETVCGNDDRTKINSTTLIPWRWVAFIRITWPNGAASIASASFIGPRTLITSGHCIYSHANGGWARQVLVVPAKNGPNEPYRSAIATSFRSVNGWINNKDASYDYGAILLPNRDLGNRVGWFGFASLSDSALGNLLVNNSGYPGDKPYGTQWFNAGRITKVGSRLLEYMIDTYGGQSGSPVWRYANGQRHIIGIHGYGGCPNKAVRVTKPVFDNMLAWKNL